MKNKSLKFLDKLVMALLGLFPFFSGCDEPRELYGVPTATYQIQDTTTVNLLVDKEKQPVETSNLKDFKLSK